jgi:glycosyltransferase involved in cell wall biosynthesis
MSVKISLHIIAKDEVGKVANIIEKYGKYFDAIDVAVDERVEDFKKLNANIYPYEWGDWEKENKLLDFARKRNFLANRCKTEYYFRLDTDDEIVNPEKVREVVERANNEKVTVISTYYDYSKDEWGNTTAAHYRETIIENSQNIYWNKPIHENIIPIDETFFILVADESLKINHIIDKEHSIESVKRNMKYLVKEFNKDKEKTDPRTLAYLGRSFMALGDFEAAIIFLEKHIARSGWNEDRYLSYCQMSHIYRLHNKFDQSIACAFEALQELPNFPDAYFEIHDTYFNQEQWQKAIEWAVMGFSKPIPRTNMLIDPSAYTWRPMLSLAACYYQLGDFDKAYQIFGKAKVYVPTLDYVKKNEKTYEDAYYHQKYIDRFTWLLTFTRDKDPDKVADLVKSVPKELQQHDAVCKARSLFLPHKIWGENEVTIFCGTTWEPFTPKSVETGIGGSEEAVINLSKELVKLGYKVTVYNDCGDDEGIYDGVEYQNVIRFNQKDAFNILISWRCNVFSYGIEAGKKLIWVHDLPLNLNLHEKDPRTYGCFDKLIMLSNYHTTLLPGFVPKEKIYVSTNGIVPEDFEVIKGIERYPHRLIYASSYNRGLEGILNMWSDIRKEVPDAEIHCYYGWDTYDKAVLSGDVKDDGFKAQMLKLMSQEGVFEHGRIGHKELLKEYAKAAIFAYPCTYTGEINCIALTKAIACGCFPVTNNFAVLKERNPFSKWVKTLEDFKYQLLQALKHSKGFAENIARERYIQENSWEMVAKDWAKNLFPIDVPTEIIAREDWIVNQAPKDAKIVDIGSAGGVTFKDEEYNNVTRLDLDYYPKVKNFIQGDAEKLPFKDKEFDIACMGEILEHLPNPKKGLQEAMRVAHKVIITVPYEKEWHHPYAIPFNTIEKTEKEIEKSRDELYPDKDYVIHNREDNLEHLFHHRWYDYEKLKKELESAGAKDYTIKKLRKSGVSFFGVIINADTLA